MLNETLELIQEHLSLLEMALTSSYKIYYFASIQKIDFVSTETDNRARLMNIIDHIQSDVEKKASSLESHEITKEAVTILKSWMADIELLNNKIDQVDKETVELLSQQKEETTKEIATIYKNKESIKNYNHSLKK